MYDLAPMTNPLLKPCPFCGDANPRLGKIIEGDMLLRGFIIECSDCTANMDRCETEEEAVEYWNCRAVGGSSGAEGARMANPLREALAEARDALCELATDSRPYVGLLIDRIDSLLASPAPRST
jgi:Lar family restriction alleviation protein